MNSQQKTIAILFGPTASGKSELALTIAPQIDAEIVNIDSAQCYTPLNIGTAKPDWKNQIVPHHLFDIIDQPVDYSASDYRTRALQTCEHIWSKNHIPLFVGGSGFYIKSLFFPIQAPIPTEAFNNDVPQKTTSQLWHELFTVDPVRAGAIHCNDRYRIRRALQIWYQTGIQPHQFIPSFNNPAHQIILIWINRPRNDLYTRIDTRVHQMFEQGWIQEVKSLMGTPWEELLLSKKFIGYDNIINFLKAGHMQNQTLIQTIQTRTRHYAKRQLIYWKSLKQSLHPYMSTHDITIQEFVINNNDQELHKIASQLTKNF